MVSALVSRLSGPGFSPDWEHCVVFGNRLYSNIVSLQSPPKCINGYRQTYLVKVTHTMDLHPIQGRAEILQVAYCYRNQERQVLY